MTISGLLSNLEPLRCLHPFTPVNIDSIYYDGRSVTVAAEDSELESMAEELAEARSDFEHEKKERDAAEAERDEMEAQMIGADRKADEAENAGLSAVMEESRRWREIATRQLKANEDAQAELTALRKRKGVASGFIKQQSAILALLDRVGHSDDIDLKERAMEILSQIYKQ